MNSLVTHIEATHMAGLCDSNNHIYGTINLSAVARLGHRPKSKMKTQAAE